MSARSKNSMISLIVWTIVLVTFFVIFFQGSGPTEWGNNRTLRFLSALLFGIGYIVHFVMLFLDKKEPLDERTKFIQLKSTNITMILTLMYVFLFCIILYTKYLSSDFVPVAWLWFIGYTTVFITFVVNSAAYLIIEKRDTGYETS